MRVQLKKYASSYVAILLVPEQDKMVLTDEKDFGEELTTTEAERLYAELGNKIKEARRQIKIRTK